MTIWNQVCWFIGFITCLSGILVHEWWLKPFWCTAKVGIDGKKEKKKKGLWLGVFTDLVTWPCPTFFPRSSFSFEQEVSYWLFSVVATLSLLLSDSMRAFLLVASSVKALTCKRWSEAKDKPVKGTLYRVKQSDDKGIKVCFYQESSVWFFLSIPLTR